MSFCWQDTTGHTYTSGKDAYLQHQRPVPLPELLTFTLRTKLECSACPPLTSYRPRRGPQTKALVEIIVTLKDAKGCTVLQFPHSVWIVSSSNAGSTLTGCVSDDQAKVHLTLGRALLEKAGHQSFLLIES